MDENQTPGTKLIPQTAGLKKQFTTVTPLSKFLAMILFIALPFIGFWFGLQYQITESVIGNISSDSSPKAVGPAVGTSAVNANATEKDLVIDQADIATSSNTQPNDKVIWLDVMNKYTSDGRYVYFNDVKIEEADAQSFEIVADEPFPTGPYSGEAEDVAHYAKDKNNVYYDGKVINGAVSSSFKVVWVGAIVSEQVYALDEKNVYYRGQVLTPQADPSSFVPLGALSNSWRVSGSYSHDGNHVYFEDKEVMDADLSTFNSEYEDNYASDKNHVFLEGKIVPHMNPENFTFPVHEP